MGGSSSSTSSLTLLVGSSPHFNVPVAANTEDAQRHAQAKIASLLSHREALEALCHDLFQSVSDDGCGGGVSRSGLRMLTRLVIDGCQVSDPAALQELLDVLAPLPTSGAGAEAGDDDGPRLGYDGFICYARCVLRVVDAALRAETASSASTELASKLGAKLGTYSFGTGILESGCSGSSEMAGPPQVPDSKYAASQEFMADAPGAGYMPPSKARENLDISDLSSATTATEPPKAASSSVVLAAVSGAGTGQAAMENARRRPMPAQSSSGAPSWPQTPVATTPGNVTPTPQAFSGHATPAAPGGMPSTIANVMPPATGTRNSVGTVPGASPVTPLMPLARSTYTTAPERRPASPLHMRRTLSPVRPAGVPYDLRSVTPPRVNTTPRLATARTASPERGTSAIGTGTVSNGAVNFPMVSAYAPSRAPPRSPLRQSQAAPATPLQRVSTQTSLHETAASATSSSVAGSASAVCPGGSNMVSMREVSQAGQRASPGQWPNMSFGSVAGPARDVSPIRTVSSGCYLGSSLAVAAGTTPSSGPFVARQMQSVPQPLAISFSGASAIHRTASPSRARVCTEPTTMQGSQTSSRSSLPHASALRSISPSRQPLQERVQPMRATRLSAPPPSVTVREMHTPGRRSPTPSQSGGPSSLDGSFNVQGGPSLSSTCTAASAVAAKVDVDWMANSALTDSMVGLQMSRQSLGNSMVQSDSPIGKAIAAGPASVGASADAAAGGASMIGFQGASFVAACSASNTSAKGAVNFSDVPDVLRQHLDRRKAQLNSMQQRLAKLSTECDSLQGMMTSSES